MNAENFTTEESAAIARVAVRAFLEGLGLSDFLSLNCDALIAFRCRHGLSREVVNTAWSALQNSEVEHIDREMTLAMTQLFGRTYPGGRA